MLVLSCFYFYSITLLHRNTCHRCSGNDRWIALLYQVMAAELPKSLGKCDKVGLNVFIAGEDNFKLIKIRQSLYEIAHHQYSITLVDHKL